MQDRSARPASATTVASVVQSALCNTDTNTSTYTCTFSSTPVFGDEALVLIGASTIASVTSGYSSVGTGASSTSRVSAYFASTATKSFTATFSSASDVHIAMLELANAGTPTTFSSASGESAPKVTATANAIVVDMFGEQYGYPYYGTIPSGWTEYYPPSPNSAGSGSNQLDSLIDVGATANSSYGLADSPYLVSASFQVPTKTGTATPSPAPTSTASPGPYDSLKKISPAGGSFSYYPTSPFHATMPPSPALVSTSQSAAWNGMQNSQGFGAITVRRTAAMSTTAATQPRTRTATVRDTRYNATSTASRSIRVKAQPIHVTSTAQSSSFRLERLPQATQIITS